MAFIRPNWPAPSNIKTLITTRFAPVFNHDKSVKKNIDDNIFSNDALIATDSEFNLALHIGDSQKNVLKNRIILDKFIGKHICWLSQKHTSKVLHLDDYHGENEIADGAFTHKNNHACAALTADCSPVFLCDKQGKQISVIHAGWKGLCQHILANGIHLFDCDRENIMAYLGPAISQKSFEVGEEVLTAFEKTAVNESHKQRIHRAFSPIDMISGEKKELSAGALKHKNTKKYYADLYALARDQLNLLGVNAIYGGEYCTYTSVASENTVHSKNIKKDASLFYSYRRSAHQNQPDIGRIASLIWME